MTTPDPADVHTGTDRVELTDDEREQLWQSGEVSILNCDHDSNLVAAVESIVAARVQEYAEKFESLSDRAKTAATELGAKNDRLAAELAAANARCADYENGISWGTSCISCAKTLDSSYAEYVRAERLQATLDRVTASCTCGATDA